MPVVVSRHREGVLRAFYNTCTHHGAVLAPKQRGNYGASFTCMCHAWNFDLAERCTGVPYPEDYGDMDRRLYDISPVRVAASMLPADLHRPALSCILACSRSKSAEAWVFL